MLSFSAGGWVILLAVLLTLGILGWRVASLWSGGASRAVGDGRTVATYGFDISTCLIPREQVVAGGMPKDGLPALIDPAVIPASEVDSINEAMHGKFLVPADRVIGVHLNGQSRAYPLRMLNWHEIANDTVGGVPIAVTYNPLCDSAVVFDRRVGGQTLTFGVSGLLYNSNLLMYDRRSETGAESLWSQLQGRAVAGPAAGLGHRLEILPAALVRLGDWRKLHANSEVLGPNEAFMDRYKRAPYVSYYGSDRLRFPVQPAAPPAGPPNKTQVVAIGSGPQRRVFSLPDIARRADASGVWQTTVGEVPVRLTYSAEPPTVLVEPDAPGRDLPAVYSFWFAWYAMHPGSVLE